MRILILGGDGYLGWPTSMDLAAKGHDVVAVDNYTRRTIAKDTDSLALFETPDLEERAAIFKAVSGYDMKVEIGDLANEAKNINLMLLCIMRSSLQHRIPCAVLAKRR